MKARFNSIANKISKSRKGENESFLREHLEWLEGAWEKEEILFF